MTNPRKVFKFFKSKSFEELLGIEGVGPEVARSIFEFFHDNQNEKFVKKLTKVGVKIKRSKLPVESSKLQGKTFVLTGALQTLTREEARERIRQYGGLVTESVSKKTNYVVVGKEPGSKYGRARRLGVRIINEQQFLNMLQA